MLSGHGVSEIPSLSTPFKIVVVSLLELPLSDVTAVPGMYGSAIAVGGNRFYAGLIFDALRSHGSLIFDAYKCDSIVHSSVQNDNDCVFFCFLSAHSELTVVKVSLLIQRWRVDCSVSSGIASAICHSGFVVCKGTQSLAQLLTFSGSAFGRIVIHRHTVRYGTSCNAHVESMHSTSTLCCQKGLVFCICLHLKSSGQSILLASSAEDRTIAVWERSLDTHDRSPTIDEYAGPWTLSYLLNGNNPGTKIQFTSRIWRVCVTDHGVLAAGEDCHVIWYSWLNITKSRAIKHVHRGHGVWSCAIWFGSENREEDAVIATGGNDGAVCVLPMPPKSETVSVVLRLSDALHANRCINTETHCTQDMEEASNPPSGDRKCNDFPRCLFFSPNGRLFCLTDAGNYFTVSTEEYSNSIPFQTVVQPLFRYGDVKLLDDVVCSAQTLPYPAPSNLSIDSTQSASCVGVFRGYTVSAANRSLPVVAIGDRYGKVALFLISEGHQYSHSFMINDILFSSPLQLPYLICTDLLKVKGKVMQLLWIGRSLLLIATQSDRALLISVEWDLRYPCLFRGTVARFCFHLGSKDTWATSAHHLPPSNRSPAVTNHAIFVLGLRDGSLVSYVLPPKSSLLDGLDSTPAWSLCTCHGPGGCCSITSVPRSSPPVILSCGRTYGEIRQWLVETDGRLTMLSQLSNPGGLTWVERFHLTLDGRLFALGFQSVHFKAYPLHSATTADGCIPRFSLDCLNGPPMFRAACGGAHRHWEFWLPDSSSRAQLSCSKVSPGTESVVWSEPTSGPVLAFVKRCDVVVQSQPPPSNVCSTLKRSLQLRPGLHGRDLNCCLVFSYPCTSPVDRSSDAIVRSGTLLYCLAGGEDTCLSSWALQVNSAAQEKDVVFVCAPEHHRGHISNIRCLTVPRTIGSEYQTKPSSRFLLTGGGRGQIGLWRFNVPDLGSGDLWRPGWLGYTLLRLTESTDPRTQHHRRAKGVSSSVNPSLSADLRIMALLCSETPEVSNCDTRLLSLAACSDGSIRLLVIYPPNHTHPKSCKFVELGSLRQLCPGSRWRHPAACYLDLQWVECGVPDRLNVLATNTRGCVECWSVCLVDADPTTWIVSENWSLFAEPIAPFYVLTAPAINCVDTFTLTPFDWHLAVGGDDGSVRIGSFLFAASRLSSPSWITAATHHYASVIQLRVVKRDIYDASGVQRLLTLAADQRLIVWSWSGTKLLPLCCSLLPGLGDPHGLALDWLLLSQGGTVGHSSTWALTVGTGLCLLELDGQS